MRAGFTLSEVLIASSLLVIGMGATAFLMATAFGTYRAQDRRMEHDRLLHDQLETLAGAEYRSLERDLAAARNPDVPERDALGADRDFVKLGDGAVTAKFELVPTEGAPGDYTVKARNPISPIYETLGGKPRERAEVTVRLEHWDPELDKPTADDRGLIRAHVTLEFQGRRDRGVVYKAR